jgi:TatD family-associated radical SAM protein
MDVLCESASLIKEKRHGVPLRVKTNGLISSSHVYNVTRNLKQAGIDTITVHLACDSPTQYIQIMQPQEGRSFNDVCAFICAAVETELQVTCTAVDMNGVDISKIRSLASALGAVDFKAYKYFP